jgi:hypothetical protein
VTKEDLLARLQSTIYGYYPLCKNGEVIKLIPSGSTPPITYSYDKNKKEIKAKVNIPLEKECYFEIYLRNLEIENHKYEKVKDYIAVPIYKSCVLKVKKL